MRHVSFLAIRGYDQEQITHTLRQFQDRFPTEAICLDHLFQVRFGTDFDCPGCDRPAKFNRVKGRRAYQCNWCRFQLYPTAGTPFDRTRTSLRDWFYVMFLFTTTRNGVAAKRVERELGVTYKTAWRMCDQIRKYMSQLDSDDPLGGVGEIVEIDETLVGGAVLGKGRGPQADNKTTVLGMLERGGELVTRVVPDVRAHTLMPLISGQVLPGTTIHTDRFKSYQYLNRRGYQHDTVNHVLTNMSAPHGCTVNSIEGYLGDAKAGHQRHPHSRQREASSEVSGEV